MTYRSFVILRRPEGAIEVDYEVDSAKDTVELYPPDGVTLTDKERIEAEETIRSDENERFWDWKYNG